MATFDLLFIGFSVNLILASFFTVTSVNSVLALMGLIFAFLNTFCLFFLMELEFIGLLFLIVYVGAISVLFLFSIMLFNLKDVIKSKTISFVFKNVLNVFLLILITTCIVNFFDESQDLFFIELFVRDIKDLKLRDFLYIMYNMPDWPGVQYMFMPYAFHYNELPLGNYDELILLGQVLYNRYFIYLILTALVLLISMIGAVTLINNPKEQIQTQHISKQISRTVRIKNIK